MVSDREARRTAVYTGVALQEEMLRSEWEEKCHRRKERVHQRSPSQTPSHAVTAAARAAQILAGLTTREAAALETN